MTNSPKPNGGVTPLISNASSTTIPNQMGSKPSDKASGKKIGTVISIIDTWSISMPRTSNNRNIATITATGGKSSPVTSATNPLVAPEIARIWLNVDDAMTMINTITVILRVPVSDSRIARQVSVRNATARMSTPSTPKAAASDGVATPRMIRPMTMNITSPMGSRWVRTNRMRRDQGWRMTAYRGAASGSMRTWP